jgi:hypothetical protein
MSKWMVRKIILKCTHSFFFVTNSYPQERESGQRSPDMKVWKRGHRGSDPLNPVKLCTLVAEAQLVSSSHTFVACSLLSMLSRLQFASLCRKSIRKKWSNDTVKASTGRMSH